VKIVLIFKYAKRFISYLIEKHGKFQGFSFLLAEIRLLANIC